MKRKLVGVDFCGTFFSRQSLSDLSYFAIIGRPFKDAPAFLRKPRISKFIQILFILFTTKAKRVSAIRTYSFYYSAEVNPTLLEKYFITRDDIDVFIASGSAFELIQEICSLNGINCPIIAASILEKFSIRLNNFFLNPWIGETKAIKIKERYPSLVMSDKLDIFETDSALDRPVALITKNYVELKTSERFGSDS